MSSLKWITLSLRWLMEAGIIVGLVYWGTQTGESTATRILLAVGAPVVLFGFWGFVDFSWMKHGAEAARLAQELLISGVVGIALITSGHASAGWAMIAVSIVYHIMVYATGDRLIKVEI